MTDWDKDLRKRRSRLDRAQTELELAIADANADGQSLRWIAERVRMNHEVVRKVAARINEARAEGAMGEEPTA